MRVSMGNWGEVVFCFALGGTCVVLPKAELGSANIIQGKDNTFVLPNTHLLYSQTHIYCCATAYTHIYASGVGGRVRVLTYLCIPVYEICDI